MKLLMIASMIFLFTFSARAGGVSREFLITETWMRGRNLFRHRIFFFLMWTIPPPGSWEIVDGELHAISPDESTRLLTIGDETWRDYTIEFDVKPLGKPGRSNIAIAARIKGELGGMVCHWRFAVISRTRLRGAAWYW